MSWRGSALTQLLVLSVHLCAAPFTLLQVPGLGTTGRTICETTSGLRDTLPLALEEKLRLKAIPVALRAEVAIQDLQAPRTLEWELHPPKTCLRLRGFEPRVFERPPPLTN